MGAVAVVVGQPYDAWCGSARAATLASDQTARCVALLEPEGTSADVDGVIAAVGPDLQWWIPGVLPVLGVAAVERRLAWIYEGGEFVSSIHLTPESVSPRAATEIVAAAADTLVRARQAGHPHPAIDATQILVDHRGKVLVTGFFSLDQRESDDAALVLQLGRIWIRMCYLVAPLKTLRYI